MSEWPHKTTGFRAELRWTDFDGYGHMHSSARLVLIENAREKFLNADFDPTGGPLGYVLAHLSVDYLEELRFQDGDHVTCRIGIESFGRWSLRTWERVESASGRLVSRARCVLASWDPEARPTRELTGPERAALVALGVPERHGERTSPLTRDTRH